MRKKEHVEEVCIECQSWSNSICCWICRHGITNYYEHCNRYPSNKSIFNELSVAIKNLKVDTRQVCNVFPKKRLLAKSYPLIGGLLM